MKRHRLSSSHHFADSPFWVEAYAMIKGASTYKKVSFPLTGVDMLSEMSSETSILTLTNGLAIPVYMGMVDLREKLSQPVFKEGNVIDLKDVTGMAFQNLYTDPKARAVDKLSKLFNPQAGSVFTKESDLLIGLYARLDPEQGECQYMSFSARNVDYFERAIRCPETETVIFFKRDTSPNKGFIKRYYVPIPLDVLARALVEAKENRQSTLDLSDMSRPKSPKAMKPQ